MRTYLGEVIMGAQHKGTLINRQHPHKGIRFGGDGDVHVTTSIHLVWSEVYCHL